MQNSQAREGCPLLLLLDLTAAFDPASYGPLAHCLLLLLGFGGRLTVASLLSPRVGWRVALGMEFP